VVTTLLEAGAQILAPARSVPSHPLSGGPLLIYLPISARSQSGVTVDLILYLSARSESQLAIVIRSL
jgi:hypothetical protein